MNWKTVKLIFHRELRDQLRDRRTLFTIAVLPLLMYPLLGMVFLQMANFSKEHASVVRVLGVENLPSDNPILVDGKISEEFLNGADPELLQLIVAEQEQEHAEIWDKAIESQQLLSESKNEPDDESSSDTETENSLQKLLNASGVDCLVVVPDGFAKEIDGQLQTEVQVFAQASNDKSRIAATRMEALFASYRDKLVTQNLKNKEISAAEIRPFQVTKIDLSSDVSKRAAVWSRVLPFVVFIWALTGAFYPAIDLCAGEKERGTLETLLSSPASRTEIVWGKLLTVMTFSMGTSLLNLFSMSFTGLFVINSMARMSESASALGSPPFHAFGWLVVALVPLSALFSATSLAIASFARSSKEGQYYLMPILMISVPLMMLPMMPGAELDLGTSLIPISGLMLVLRALIENRLSEALQFAAPVLGVTFCCCLLVIQWAVRQFSNEKVLFRESERVGIGSLFRNLVRERRAMPTFLEAIFCGILLLVIRFFTTLVATQPGSFGDFARQTLILHVGLIIGPVVLMAIILTTNPLKTLGLTRPKWRTIPLAILMAFCLHPIITGFQQLVLRVYPMPSGGGALQELMEMIFSGAPSFLYIILLFALLPAISEELAFRGFIMNGLRQSGDRWTAILLSSLFFGATHGLLQQSMIAFFTGTVIGFISFQAGSILPAMFYHFTHNSVTVSLSQLNASHLESYSWTKLVLQLNESGGLSYTLPAYFVMSIIGISIFVWFYRLTKNANPPKTESAMELAPTAGPVAV